MIVMIDYERYAHLLDTCCSPNFPHMVMIVCSLSRSSPIPFNGTIDTVDGGYQEYQTIVHPSSHQCAKFVICVEKVIEFGLTLLYHLQFFRRPAFFETRSANNSNMLVSQGFDNTRKGEVVIHGNTERRHLLLNQPILTIVSG